MSSPIIGKSQRKGRERDKPTDDSAGAVGPPTTHIDATGSGASPLFKSFFSGLKSSPRQPSTPFAAARHPSITKADGFDSPHVPNRIPEPVDVPAKGSTEPNIREKENLELITGAIDTLRQLSEIDELVPPNAMETVLGKVSYVLSVLKQMIRNEAYSEDLIKILDSHQRAFDQQVVRLKADDVPALPSPLYGPIKQYSAVLERITAAIISGSGMNDMNALRGTRWERAKTFASRFTSESSEKMLSAYVSHLSTAMDGLMIALEIYSSFTLTEMSAEMLLGNRKPGYVYQRTALPTTSNDEDIILAGLRLTGLRNGSRLPGCTGETRKAILENIINWTTIFDAPNILWLKGPLGVGKSAIATTIVQELNKARRLGSNFFFQRQEAAIMTPGVLWRTVAYDLAEKYPMVRRTLVTKLREGKIVPTAVNIDDLFLHLIHEPLSESEGIPDGQLPIIVIDALDECGGLDGPQSEHRRSLMRTLKSWARLSGKFKLIVTSQDDEDIREVFSTTNHLPIEILAGHKQSSEDIKIFLTNQLQQVRHTGSASPYWLRPEIIEKLADSAGGLFIWAEAVVKFVNLGEPALRLSQVLAAEVNGNMAALYGKILEISFPNPTDQENFRHVVGTIILAKAPLSPSSLAHLLSMEVRTVDRICSDLQPVMDSGGIFHHQSFVDFLMDPTQCPLKFLIKRERENRTLTLACLQVMKNQLRFNICKLESSYKRNVDIPDLALRIKDFILPHLSYSSIFWASHLAETLSDVDTLDRLQWFMQNQFLFWLEILSIIKRADLASSILSLLIGWISRHGKDNAVAMALDMQKFEAVFAPAISCSAPHIYLSALPFSPQNSAVSRQYMQDYPQTLRIQNGGLRDWLAIPNVFSGHRNWVWSVAFSCDGKRIVSGSDDKTVRVWNVETGEAIVEPFKGHIDSVWSVAFSPDGAQIVSGSSDTQVRVWNAETGENVVGPLRGHNGAVTSVTFSPDGAYIVSGSKDKTIRVWDAKTGTAVAGPFIGHGDSVWSVAFSPDGTRIVSGSSDTQVRIWDAKTGEVVGGPFRGHENWVNSVAFSPDGTHVISGSDDKTIRVWNAGKSGVGEMIAGPFIGHSDWIRSVAVSPDGKRIVSGSDDETIRVWDADQGTEVMVPFEGHTGAILSIAFSPDGQSFASGARDETVRVWDIMTGMMVNGPYKGHTDSVSTVEFSPDGTRIVSASKDTTIRVWDARTGTIIAGPFIGHDEGVLSAKFSPDGKRIVSGSADNTIRMWNAETGTAVGEPFTGHRDSVFSVAFSPDGTRIVSGSNDAQVRVWNAKTGEMVAGPFQPHVGSVASVAFSPNGKRIVSGSHDESVLVLDAMTGEIVAGPYVGHSDWVRSVAFSPDGKYVVSGSDDLTIRVWDAEPGLTMKPLEGHSDCVSSVAYSPNGGQIISGSLDKKIRVWDATTGEVAAGPFEGHRGPVSSVAFSPDGKRIISGSGDQEIRVWNAEPGVAMKPFEGHDDWVCSVAFSADGKHIVSGSGDKTVRVWNAETGKAVGGPLEGHGGSVNCVRFSPDGNRITSGSDDNTVRVWDAETSTAVGEPFIGHSGPVWAVAFSPDGAYIVSGSSDKTIRVWDARAGTMVAGPFNGHNDDVWSVDLSHDGTRVVSGSGDKTVRVWNAKTGEVVAGPFKGHDGFVASVAFSPDGKLVISGSGDREIRVWNVETGKLCVVCRGHSAQVNSVAFSPDGKRIVSASHDDTARVWNAETGEVVAGPFKGHNGFIASVAFSPYEWRVASASVDKTIRVWDVTTSDSEIDQTSPSFTEGSNMEDGWILGSKSELLFWVPPMLRPGLRWPRTLLVIGKDISTELGLKSFVHGKSWHLCKR